MGLHTGLVKDLPISTEVVWYSNTNVSDIQRLGYVWDSKAYHYRAKVVFTNNTMLKNLRVTFKFRGDTNFGTSNQSNFRALIMDTDSTEPSGTPTTVTVATDRSADFVLTKDISPGTHYLWLYYEGTSGVYLENCNYITLTGNV